MQLGHVDRRIGGVPGGQEGDRRGEEGALLGHEVHGALVDVEAVDQLLAAKADGIVGSGVVVVAVAPHRDADQLGLVDDGLDLLGAVVLVATRVPAPDATAGSPDLDGIGVLTQAATNGLAQIPRTVDLIAPRMGLFVLELAAVVGVTVAGGAAEAEAGGEDARTLEDALIDAVANLNAEAADLAHGGQTVGEAVVGLLDSDGLLLEERLHDPVGVIVGEVAGEVQVGVDEAGHDGLTGSVDDLVALRGVLVGAGVLDLAVLVDENQGVLNRIGTGAVDELAADDCILLTHVVPPYWNDGLASGTRPRGVRARPGMPQERRDAADMPRWNAELGALCSMVGSAPGRSPLGGRCGPPECGGRVVSCARRRRGFATSWREPWWRT
ncbi:Uncharacterised protein [Collinsella intestinalis]|nr:Uncharacterised protein [Collinsella intestinalis]